MRSASPTTSTELALLPRPDAGRPPTTFPDGVNLEFVRGPSASGTSPCGSTSAAWGRPSPAAPAPWPPRPQPAPARATTRRLPVTYRVDVPGGTVEVELTEDQAFLTGPAVLVAHGEVAVPPTHRKECQCLFWMRSRCPARSRWSPAPTAASAALWPRPWPRPAAMWCCWSATPRAAVDAVAELEALGVTATAGRRPTSPTPSDVRRAVERDRRPVRPGRRAGEQRRDLHPPAGAGGHRRRVATRDGRQRQRRLELRPGLRPADGGPAAAGRSSTSGRSRPRSSTARSGSRATTPRRPPCTS